MEIHSEPRWRYTVSEIQRIRDQSFHTGFIYGMITLGAIALVISVAVYLVW